MQEQDDLIQHLHDHKWKETHLPRSGGFLEQEARWVDAMNVIDAALATLQVQRARDQAARAELDAKLESIRRAQRGARGHR